MSEKNNQKSKIRKKIILFGIVVVSVFVAFQLKKGYDNALKEAENAGEKTAALGEKLVDEIKAETDSVASETRLLDIQLALQNKILSDEKAKELKLLIQDTKYTSDQKDSIVDSYIK